MRINDYGKIISEDGIQKFVFDLRGAIRDEVDQIDFRGAIRDEVDKMVEQKQKEETADAAGSDSDRPRKGIDEPIIDPGGNSWQADIKEELNETGQSIKEYLEKPDEVNHPAHYTGADIECIDAIKAALGDELFSGYCEGNVIKYLWRHRQKGGIVDLKKAQWYLNTLISAKTEQLNTKQANIDKVTHIYGTCAKDEKKD